MIEPWQVWLANLDPIEGNEQGGVRPVIVVSSEFHLRVMQGRNVLIVPVTSRDRQLRTRVEIMNPKGETNYAITEQIRFISTRRFECSQPWWQLAATETVAVQRALRLMVDL